MQLKASEAYNLAKDYELIAKLVKEKMEQIDSAIYETAKSGKYNLEVEVKYSDVSADSVCAVMEHIVAILKQNGYEADIEYNDSVVHIFWGRRCPDAIK